MGLSVIDRHGHGVIGIASSFLGRYREFDICLSNLLAPTDSRIDWRMSVNIAHNFNGIIRSMNPDDQWVFMLGDDHVFSPDLLIKLLEREVDVVVPFCLRRNHPFLPILIGRESDGYPIYGWEWIGKKAGLVDAFDVNLGNAGMLIRRHVIEGMEEPWFECGRTDPEVGGSDIWFCEKLRKAGFKLYLDMENTIGHITHAAVWPVVDENGKWHADLMTP